MKRSLLNTVAVLGALALTSATLRPAAAQATKETAATATVVKVGEPAPDFSLAGSDGKTYRLADLRGNKNLVLVIFRGVW